ncbi:hypothetical protein K2173_020164 [Erythroxylum novogranatense]|uniref:Cytochrome P450 n=1 Tax=Erythroxylum novogranatense TaxID=1862640 RepID=A0AAV8U9Z9_9ROSI|nr:hypothetical protein K2173_020164 [Erythroxylum novogranatense]
MQNSESPFVSLYTTIAALLFIFILWKILTRTSGNLPPGPWKLPIIGNLLNVGALPHRTLRDLAKKYGPVMHIKLGEISSVVISSPETAKIVLKTHDMLFAGRPFILAAHIIWYESTDIIYAPYGEYWRRLRKFCITELLGAKRVQSYRQIRADESLNMIKTIAGSVGSSVNLSKIISSFSLNITSRSSLGKIDTKQEAEFMEHIHKFAEELGGFSFSDLFPSIKILGVISGERSRLEKLHRELDTTLENIMGDHEKRKADAADSSQTEAELLLDVLLNLQERGQLDFPITRNNVKAVIMDMFVAGTSTSSAVIEWAMSEMMKNPRILRKAQAEVREVYKGKETIDETNLHMLNYLNLVIKETLRMYPPGAILVPRLAGEKTEIDGYEIPRKSTVLVNAWAINRDPNYWEDAETFYPERFADNSIDYKGTHYEYIPFGAGRRMCPGISFGLAVVELGLASLLYHFDWEIADGVKPADLDMTESWSGDLVRKNNLFLIPTSYLPLPVRS